ncbi:hypothetical protein [Thermomonas sp.]|uniref:hypothetical protein n=1 Tax=Thermomonas sp. TaxID=1971895 RepID=UPI002489E6E0|nr:hypothetical protein [Thermomonas sp.]MDI1251975.1 hypothetical protein [Thermomonas sp.]
MKTAAPVPERTRGGRLARFAIIIAILLVVLGLIVGYLLQPQRASALLLDRVGSALGLRITASGQASYRLRGTPQLVLHDVVVQRPGDASALLRAERVFVAVPWSTIRARGADLTVQRIELDAPILDVPALQRWLATQPPSETRIPTLTNGLRIRRGRIDNGDWAIDGIGVDLPSLAPGKPLHTRLQGRYLYPPTTLPFDLDVALTQPANNAGMAVIGKATLEGDGWKLPAQVYLVGPLHLGDNGISISPAKFGLSARYISANSNLPFVLGAAGPLRFDKAVWALDPAAMILHGGDVIPDTKAKGALALGPRLVLRLQGDIAAWPDVWPALPPPLSVSTSPMPFSLDYVGHVDFSEAASLTLRRDATTFDARFKLPAILDWIDSGMSGSPLPPLTGHLQTPRIEIAGATLESVEVEFKDDPALPRTATPAPAKP